MTARRLILLLALLSAVLALYVAPYALQVPDAATPLHGGATALMGLLGWLARGGRGGGDAAR